jgi:hypothetical protein
MLQVVEINLNVHQLWLMIVHYCKQTQKSKSISVPKLVSSTQELSVFPSISGIKI